MCVLCILYARTCVHMCLCARAHRHVRTPVYTCMYTHLCVYAQVWACIYKHMCTCTHVLRGVYMCVMCMSTCAVLTCSCVHTCTDCACVRMCMHVHMHVTPQHTRLPPGPSCPMPPPPSHSCARAPAQGWPRPPRGSQKLQQGGGACWAHPWRERVAVLAPGISLAVVPQPSPCC